MRNIGLLLSGDIDKPSPDADTVVVKNGVIVAVGKAANLDTDAPDLAVDARQTRVCAPA